MLSSLTTTSTTAQTISSYLRYVSIFTKRGDLSLDVWDGVDKDDLLELTEDLVKLREAYTVERDDDASGGEEYELDL